MEILEIKKVKQQYQVTIDDMKHQISEENILKYQLYVGKHLSIDELNELLNQEAKQQLLSKVLGFLSYKERSETEVKTYLYQKSQNYPLTLEILEKLKTLHYIDDEQFATHLIESYIAKGRGKTYIKQKLMEKGIHKQTIESALMTIDESILIEKMMDVVNKELTRLNKYPVNKQKQMLMEKLLRYGYGNESIYYVLAQFQFQSNHKELLEKEYEKLKRKHEGKNTKEVKQKIIQSLIMKGFDFHEISQLMKLDEN